MAVYFVLQPGSFFAPLCVSTAIDAEDSTRGHRGDDDDDDDDGDAVNGEYVSVSGPQER
jgi:hypothetical protein